MKIRFILLSLLTLLAVAVHPRGNDYYVYTSFHEPATDGLRFLYSDDGLHWDSIRGIWLAPSVGEQRVMRDPSIQQSPDGTFHLVWTSSWRGDRGFGYSFSRDLIHWTTPRYVEVMTDTTTVNVWAPELFWDDSRSEMMVVWASCVPGKYARGIEEENNNHRLYYSTTRDFVTFSEPRLLTDPGFSSIDATIVRRGPHDYVMVFKDNTRPARNLRTAFATDPHGPWSAPSEPFTPFMTEGPSVAQMQNGQYVVYFDSYGQHDFGAMQTQDFLHFTDISTMTSIPSLHKHGTIFRAPRSVVKKMLRKAKHHK